MKASFIIALLLNVAHIEGKQYNYLDADEEATYLSLMEQHHHHKSPKKGGDAKMIKKKDFDQETGKVKMVKKSEHQKAKEPKMVKKADYEKGTHHKKGGHHGSKKQGNGGQKAAIAKAMKTATTAAKGDSRIKELATRALSKVEEMEKTGYGPETEQVHDMDSQHMAMKALWTLSLSQNRGHGENFSANSPEGIAVNALQNASLDDSAEAITDLAKGEFRKSESKGDKELDNEEEEEQELSKHQQKNLKHKVKDQMK